MQGGRLGLVDTPYEAIQLSNALELLVGIFTEHDMVQGLELVGKEGQFKTRIVI